MNTKIKKSVELMLEDNTVISPAARIPYYPLAVKSGYGSTIVDVDGNEYIDLLSSAAALNTGHAHPRVVEAIQKQVSEFIHYTPAYMYHEPLVRLAKKLTKITPGEFDKRVAFGLSGSDANDGMIKLARSYTGRSKIISFVQAYHGSTYGAISLTALSLNMRRKIGPLLPEIYHIPYPDCYRCPLGHKKQSCNMDCLNQLKTAFKYYLPAEEVAAIFMEPIAGDAGLVVPPREYIESIFKLCQENGILFVSEEVQQGFGRTGKWFGIENFGITPDSIVMGKSIASGMPLSAIVTKAEIMKAWEAPAHLFTMGGSPTACQAAIATINIIEDEKLLQHTVDMGVFTKSKLDRMQQKYEIIGDVRGIGLSIGVDLVKDLVTKEKNKKAAAKICYRCWEKGLILSFVANSVLRIQPPLVITKDQLTLALDIIEDSIKEYLSGDIPDEVLNVVKGW